MKKFYITNILTNYVSEPSAIDYDDCVVFAWQINSPERNVFQRAYQITVYSVADNALVWDSGKCESEKSAGIVYKGGRLKADSDYTWSVKVWINKEDACQESAVSFFRTGLSKKDWTADFIWHNEIRENSYIYFRKTVKTKEKKITRAVIYTSAHNDYQLFLNADFVGAGPARSNPFVYGQYNCYDITNNLKSGCEAVISALVHWHGAWGNEYDNPVNKEPQRQWGDSGVNGTPMFISELRITYEDGDVQIIKTDDSWRVSADTPYYTTENIYFGDAGGKQNRASVYYDARREKDSWKNVGYDDSCWKNATVLKDIDYRLYAQLVECECERDYIKPLKVEEKDGVWFCSFDKCYTGWVKIQFPDAKFGDEIKIRYKEVGGEIEHKDGAGYDVFIAKGKSDVFYAPYVRHTSFKILEIKGYSYSLTKDDVTGIVAYSCKGKTSDFACSDEMLNSVYKMSERSARQNVQQGIISVDANREQSPWLADSWNVGIGLLYNSQNTRIIDKVIKDYAYEQKANGMFYSCSPGAIYELREWAYYWAMLLWEEYLFSGNTALLERFYPNLKRFLDDYVPGGISERGLCNPEGWRASDYPTFDSQKYMESGGENIGINSMLYGNYIIASRIAEVMNYEEDSLKYREKAKALKTNIYRYLWDNGSFLSKAGSAHKHLLASAWAVRFNVADDVIESVKNRYKEYFNSGDELIIGGYGGCTLYEALYKMRLGELAKSDFNRYRYMVNANNTNWESFGPLGPANMGNHAWSAYPAYILQKYVGGIEITKGGAGEVCINPVFEGLEWANASVDTIKGVISTNWRRYGDCYKLAVKISPNVKARVYLPLAKEVAEGENVLVKDNRFQTGIEGMESIIFDNEWIIADLGSGTFNFTCTGIRKEF